MTNPDYTAIMLVVDRSGSMDFIRASAQEAINEFITAQQTATGRRTIRIAQFDSEYDTVCASTDAAAVAPFELSPRGSTALLDAMGRSITEFGDELAAVPEAERPGTVIVAVMTDGLENSSREHTWATVKELVQRQERDYGWQILYLGANQDAIAEATKLGVRRHNTISYSATDHGTRSVIGSTISYVAAAACGQSAGFTDEQRADATSK